MVTLRGGERVAITAGDVSATGTFVAKVSVTGPRAYLVRLDGTGQSIWVTREMLTEEES